MEKKLFAVFHEYDVDGGFGDAVGTSDFVGCIYATDEEAKAYLEKWDKPKVYAHPYSDLYCFGVKLEEVKIYDGDIMDFAPYGPDVPYC